MTNIEKIELCQEIINQIQEENKRPMCRLQLTREPFSITSSHLGGTPYVPHDGQIPVDDDGAQLWLCAQINFSEAPHIDCFPLSGLLQIFLEDWHFGDFGLDDSPFPAQRYWRIVYYQEIDETVTVEECEAKMVIPWSEAKRSHMPRLTNQFDRRDIENGYDTLWRCPDIPLKVNFQSIEQDVINDEDFRFEKLFAAALTARLPSADYEQFMPYALKSDTPQEQEALNKIRQQIKGGGCKLGGYPSYLQDDPRLYDDGEGWADCDTLLLQLYDDMENNNGIDLALNGGSLNFLIRSEDLQNRDFSRVLAQWACT